MWMLLGQFIWKIIKDPKLLAILVLAILLVGSTVKGYWYKITVDRLEQRVSDLNVEIKNLNEISKKITQNRDSLVRQVEDFKEIDKKYKSLQVRIDVLKQTCAKPVKPVVVLPTQPVKPVIVSPGSPPIRSLPPGSPPSSGGVGEPKPVEKALGSTISPEGVVIPIPEGKKAKEVSPVSRAEAEIEQPEPEYQFGGREYEKNCKLVYNDIMSWWNSLDRMQPKGPTASVSDTYLSITYQTCTESIGDGQDAGTS